MTFVRLTMTSRKLDPHTRRPCRWTAIVNVDDADDLEAYWRRRRVAVERASAVRGAPKP
jgi:hypothetical protein